MKKYVLVGILVCLTAGTVLAQIQDMNTFLSVTGMSYADYYASRKLADAGIKLNAFYESDAFRIVRYVGPGGNPAEIGPIYYEGDAKGKGRRFPDYNKDGYEGISANSTVKFIRTSSQQTVEMIVEHEVHLDKPFSNNRLLVIQPNSEVEFNLKGKQTTIRDINVDITGTTKVPFASEVNADDKNGFILRKGSIKEETNFKTASKFDEVMSLYSCVPEDYLYKMVENMRKQFKPATDDDLADMLISQFTTNAGMFAGLASAAPIWMIPAEFAVDLVKNLIHSQLAYAIACVYKKRPAIGTEEFKYQLYVLFANKDNIEPTLNAIVIAAKMEGVNTNATDNVLEFFSNDELLAKIGGSKMFIQAVQKSKLPEKVTSKFTASGISKAAKIITIVKDVFTDVSGTIKFGKQAKRFYRPTPASALAKPAPKKTYTVTFMADYGQPLTVITADSNATVTFPKDPTKTGYFLREWNTDKNGRGASFNLNNRVTANLTLYPQWAEKTAPAKPNVAYSPGETGPGGGIVFIQGSPAFECSAADLGSGPESYADALTLAKNYRGGGKSDWRLPTKDELNKMYTALHRNKKGNFKNVSYWATNGSSPFAQDFGTSGTNASPNENKRLVRAVRSF